MQTKLNRPEIMPYLKFHGYDGRSVPHSNQNLLLKCRQVKQEELDAALDAFGIDKEALESAVIGLQQPIDKKFNRTEIEGSLKKILAETAGFNEGKSGSLSLNTDYFSSFIQARIHTVIRDMGDSHDLLIYNHDLGYFEEDLEVLRLIVFTYLQYFSFGDEVSTVQVENQVLAYLKRASPHQAAEQFDRDYFGTANQDIRFSDATMVEHAPEHYVTLSNQVEYDADATAPEFMNFLKTVFEADEDTINFVQKFSGYLLTASQRANVFLVIVGEGANGKSCLTSIWSKLVGITNVSAVPFEGLDAPFALQPMINKKLNLATENSTEIHNLSRLKGITSGDRLSINRKNEREISASLRSKMVFVLNDLPLFDEQSFGLARRLLVLPMKRKFEKHEQDPFLTEKLTAEMPGILNWAREGLADLIQDDYKFTESNAMREVKDQVLNRTSPVSAFMTSKVALSPGNILKSKTVHDSFLRWAGQSNVLPGKYASSAKFWQEFSNQFTQRFAQPLTRAKSGTSIVRDISILDEEEGSPFGTSVK